MIQTIMMGGYSCQQVAEHASTFVDGEMTLAQWMGYRIHLLSCPPCAEYVRQLGITVDALRSMPDDEGVQLRSKLLDAFDEWTEERSEGSD